MEPSFFNMFIYYRMIDVRRLLSMVYKKTKHDLKSLPHPNNEHQ